MWVGNINSLETKKSTFPFIFLQKFFPDLNPLQNVAVKGKGFITFCVLLHVMQSSLRKP